MAVYYVVYSSASDTYVSSGSSATYSIVRNSTASTAANVAATSGQVYNGFASPNYVQAQTFHVYDTSAIPAGAGAGIFSISTGAPTNANADTLRFRQVSTVANKIAGGSLGALTLHSDPGTFPTASGRYSSAIISVAAIPRTATFNVVLHTAGQESATGPTGVNQFVHFLADATGTTNDPYILITVGAPWEFLGVSNVVEVTAAAHALVTTGIAGTLQAGDLLVACISSRIASTTSVTLPSGGAWTLVSEQKNNNTLATNAALPSGLMAYCVRGVSNPNLTFTHPVVPSVAIGRIAAYRNVDQSSPKDTQTSFTTATAITAVSGAGLTTTQIEDLIVAMACGGQEAAWSAFNATDPIGASGATSTAAPTITWLERADSLTTTGTDTSLAIFDAMKVSLGATGNLTATASIAAGHVVIAGAFKIAGPAGYTGTGTPTAQASNADGVGISSSDGTGTPAAQATDLDGAGISASAGAGALAAGAATVDGEGVVAAAAATGTGTAQANAAALAGAGISASTGSGAADAGAATATGIGVSASAGTGVLAAQDAAAASVGVSGSTGAGTLAAEAAAVAGVGTAAFIPITGTGALFPADATAAGAGIAAFAPVTGTGTPAAGSAAASGLGVSASAGSGALAAGTAACVGIGISASTGTGSVVAGSATVAGIGTAAAANTGVLAAQGATVAGAGISASTGSGAIDDNAAVVAGAGLSESVGIGTLVAGASTVAGAGIVIEEGVAVGAGALVAGVATLAGAGEVEAVAPPVFVGGGIGRPLVPFPVEGEGYGILPQLEGEAHGVVVAVGAGAGTVPGCLVDAVGSVGVAGRSTAQLAFEATAVGARGQAGAAVLEFRSIAVAAGAIGVHGKGSGVLVPFAGTAIGRHDDDEAAIVAFLLAA